MGDHIENPLGAAGAVQPCVQVPSAPCQGQGMSAPSQIDSFSQGMALLQKQWPKLTANARVAQLQALVDAQAASNGFPAPMVVTPTGLEHRNGELRFTDWSIAINPAWFGAINSPRRKQPAWAILSSMRRAMRNNGTLLLGDKPRRGSQRNRSGANLA